jgi:ketosteroid isomerase-like protein
MPYADLIRSHYAMLSAPDPAAINAIADSLHPDYEMHELPTGPDPTVYHGREGFLAWVRQGLDVLDEPKFEVVELLEEGETALAKVHVHFVGRESRAPVETVVYHVWEMRDGKPWRVSGFLDEAEARRAGSLAAH